MKQRTGEPGSGAFFDLERTITKHSVEKEVALALFRGGEFSLSMMARVLWLYGLYHLGLLKNIDAVKQEASLSFAGRGESDEAYAMDGFFESRLKKFIYPDAAKTIREFQDLGIPVSIVSTTFTIMIAPYARHLKIHRYYGTELEAVEGVYTGRVSGAVPQQEEKARLVEMIARHEGLDLARCHAFGDSYNDRFMLEAVGHPCAVNPDRRLSRLARERGWPVARWRIEG